MELIAGIGVLIAFTQACIAFVVFRSSNERADLDRKLQAERTRVDREIQEERKRVDRSLQRAIRIHHWGNDCIVAFTEAQQLCQFRKSDFPDERTYTIRRRDLLARISALIEKGRLFFKNTHREMDDGTDKYPARRGHRPEILDPLMFAFHRVDELDGSADEGKSDRLGKWKSLFVSLLQYEVEPDWLKLAHFGDVGPGGGPGLGRTAEDRDPPSWDDNRPLPGKQNNA